MIEPGQSPADVCGDRASRDETLSAWIEGELSAAQASSWEAHIGGCQGCRAARDELVAQRDSLRALPAPPAPRAIFDAAWNQAARRRRRRVAATGAVAALAVLLFFGGLWTYRALWRRVPRVTKAPLPQALLGSAEDEFQKAETHYQKALAMLREVANTQKTFWSATKRFAFERDLRLMDAAIVQARRIARRNPTNPVMQEMLFASYTTQIEYLRDIVTPETEARAP